MNRRQFLGSTLFTATALAATGVSCRSRGQPAESGTLGKASVNDSSPARVAFNTANLVGRVTGYRYELSHWGDQHQKTVAATDEQAWRAICREIAATGFRAVEIWEAHAAPETMTAARAKTWKQILDDTGLRPIAYAGGLRRETLQICAWL